MNDIRSIVSKLNLADHWVTPDDVGDLEPLKGAYLLMLHLTGFSDPAGATELNPGWYIYAGSAYGPGGIAARLKRHFRKDKALRWHVDRLTIPAAEMLALAVPDARECDLVAKMSASGRFIFPVARFGSTDCRDCISHLLQPI